MLSVGQYLQGVVELSAALCAAFLGASRLRSRLLPGWSGPPAWTATAVLAGALVLWVAELLGAFGGFSEIPYFATVVALGIGMRLLVPGRPGARPGPTAPPLSRAHALAAVAVGALLVAHWWIRVRFALEHGMTGYDTAWYHGPFAVHFAEGGSTWGLDFIDPRYLAWFYPANSELLHGAGILAFDRDILSPFLNLVWLGGTLLAAWSVGRPYGAGLPAVLAVAVLLDSGVMADQAGTGRNDAIGLFFLLAAVAVLVNAPTAPGERRLGRGPLVVAGLASGLAAGVKLTMLAPAAALAAGIPAASPRGERRRAAVAFDLPLLAGCGFWYLRNVAHAGNPLPWVQSIGPLPLPAPDQPLGGRPQFSVLHYLFDQSVVLDRFLPRLHDNIGLLWPVVVVLAVGALLLALGRTAEPAVRAVAAAGLLGVGVWLVQGSSAEGPSGDPVGFASGLRHLAPSLAIGLVLLPILPALRRGRHRLSLTVCLLVLLPFADASGQPWLGRYRAEAIGVGFAVLAVLLALSLVRARRWPPPILAGGLVGLLAVVAALGWPVQRDYLEGRYAHPTFTPRALGRAFVWAGDLSGKRIAALTSRTYPLFGEDLSNHVQYVGRHRSHGGFTDIPGCPGWRRALNEGHYDYVVISYHRDEAGRPPFPPQAAWTGRDPAARRVLRRRPTAVFRIDGRLDPGGCAAAGPRS